MNYFFLSDIFGGMSKILLIIHIMGDRKQAIIVKKNEMDKKGVKVCGFILLRLLIYLASFYSQ